MPPSQSSLSAALAATLKGAVKASHQKAAELTVRQKWVDGIVLTPKEGSPSLFGQPVLRTTAPLFYDAYQRNRSTGSFILVDEATNDTVAAGMLLQPGT